MIVVFLLAGLGFYWMNKREDISQHLKTATLYPQPKEIVSFQLTNNKNQSFTKDSLKKHWSLLFFGFTNCGYICPTTLTELKKVYTKLEAEHVPPPQVVFISVDPERDTTARINAYVKSFNKHFMGATGSEKELQTLTNNLGVLYTKTAVKSKTDYTIDHSSSILLINPDGELTAIFSAPHDAEKITRDFVTLYQHNRK